MRDQEDDALHDEKGEEITQRSTCVVSIDPPQWEVHLPVTGYWYINVLPAWLATLLYYYKVALLPFEGCNRSASLLLLVCFVGRKRIDFEGPWTSCRIS